MPSEQSSKGAMEAAEAWALHIPYIKPKEWINKAARCWFTQFNEVLKTEKAFSSLTQYRQAEIFLTEIIAALEPKPEWTKCSDRMPTEEDADHWGMVMCCKTNYPASYSHWSLPFRSESLWKSTKGITDPPKIDSVTSIDDVTS